MLRFAMISGWHAHSRDYARIISEQPDARITCAWDEDATRGAEWSKALGVDFEACYEALLGRNDVDAIVICAPTNMHKELMIKADRAGKHIFTEKVMALNVRDCDEIIEAIEQNSVTFTICFPHCCQPQDLFVKHAVEIGLIGDVTEMRVRNCHDASLANWLPDYWYDPVTTGGGAMMDLGAHGMYLVNWILGKPRRILSAFGNFTPRPVEDNAVCVLEFEKNVFAITETSFVSPYTPVMLEVYGTKGVILCRDGDVKVRTEYTDKLVEDSWVTPKLPEPLAHPLRQFINSVLYGEPVRFGTREARLLTVLMEQAYIAHAERREVSFDS